MGTKIAPSYANTFMGWFEETQVYTYVQPLLWKRFIDDIFVIWTYGQGELNTFVLHLNTCMPTINEAEASQTLVHFLDVNVHLNTKGEVSTSQYIKTTDSHNYIDFPKHFKNGIPYGQFLRLRTICSSENGFIKQSKIMADHFLRANYPPKLVQTSFEKAYLQKRKTLLEDSQKEMNDQDSLFLMRYGKICVGQTKRRLNDRLMEHFRIIRQQCRTHIVGHHYNSNAHEGEDDVEVFVLEFISAHPESAKATHLRDTMERNWISCQRSLIHTGLNLFK